MEASERQRNVIRAFARELETPTNLFRSSGQATAIRLKALFPTMDVSRVILGDIGTGLNLTSLEVPAVKYFMSAERPSAALAQLALRNTIAKQCKDPSNQVFATDNLLMWGEKIPDNPEVALAFAAARNVWLYPYLPSQSEVLSLATLYSEVRKGGGSDAEGRQSVCMAALLAPQFWLGNPGRYDFIRKIALELGGRLPTFKEFDAMISGAVTPRDFAVSVQREPGYLTMIHQWHKDWLNLTNYASYKTDSLNLPRGAGIFGSFFGFAGIAGVKFRFTNATLQSGSSGTVSAVIADMADADYWTAASEEVCENKVQAFDATTSLLQWEQWNPASQRFEVLVVEGRDNTGAWTNDPAAIVLPVSAELPAGHLNSLTFFELAPGIRLNGSDITISFSLGTSNQKFPAIPPGAASASYLVRTYEAPAGTPPTGSRLIGTPLNPFAQGNLRVKRFDSQGRLQSGYSPVRLWWSGQTAYVCNGLSRIIATCAYRSPGGTTNGAPNFTTYNLGNGSAGSPYWIAGAPHASLPYSGGIIGAHRRTYASGRVLEKMSCGVPNLAEAGKEAPAFSETLAYPKAPPYNDVAFNLELTDTAYDTSGVQPETQAKRQIIEDLNNEPYRLIDDLVRNAKDYRLLITAPYTIGRPAFEFFLRTQALWLPGMPEGSYIRPGENGYLTTPPREISHETFKPMPRKWLVSSTGVTTSSNYSLAMYWFNEWKLPQVTPRQMSGILTQGAFINPMRPKVRSLVSRIFERLLCMDPSALVLDSAAKSLHESYMFPNPKHLDRSKGCYQCHINLDPMGRALSANFLRFSDVEADVRNASVGEIMGPGEVPIWGFQGSSDPKVLRKGAVMGKEVTGMRGVAEVVASSREFAFCVVNKMFENVFGHRARFAEAEFVKSLTDRFVESGYVYNDLILNMITSDEYMRAN